MPEVARPDGDSTPTAHPQLPPTAGLDGLAVQAAAEAAVERAKAAMKEDHSAEEVAAIQASLQKALAQLQVKRRRRG